MSGVQMVRGGDVTQAVECRVRHVDDASSTAPARLGISVFVSLLVLVFCRVSTQCSLTAFVQPQSSITSIPIFAQLKILSIGSRVQLLGHTKTSLRHTLGQPSKTECGFPSGRGVANSHIRGFSLTPNKQTETHGCITPLEKKKKKSRKRRPRRRATIIVINLQN